MLSISPVVDVAVRPILPHADGNFMLSIGKFMVGVTDVYSEYTKVFREAPLLTISGVVQHKGGVVNLLAVKASPLSG